MHYVFFDESGTLYFTPSSSKYLILTSLTLERPFPSIDELVAIKYDAWDSVPLSQRASTIEYLHATEDHQSTRDKVFDFINRYHDHFRVDATIVEKRRVPVHMQSSEEIFYREMFGLHLQKVLGALGSKADICIVTDQLPIQRKRKAVEKSLQHALSVFSARHGNMYKLVHHQSKSDHFLQLTDYFSWAIYRKWEHGDLRSYERVRSCVVSEVDVFEGNSAVFY